MGVDSITGRQPKDNRKPEAEDNNSESKNKPSCQFCGRPAKNVYFAAFVCDSEVCINKAMDARGGPAGHMKDPKKWLRENAGWILN